MSLTLSLSEQMEAAYPPRADGMLEASRRLSSDHGQAIEAYIRVYVESTGASIEDIELVERQEFNRDGVIVTSWYCRARKSP